MSWTGKRAAEEVGALKQIAISATRVAAEPRASLNIGRSNLRQAASTDSVTARHALGLAINVARKVSRLVGRAVQFFPGCLCAGATSCCSNMYGAQDPRHVIDGLAELILDAVQLYEMAGPAAFAPKKAAKGAAPVGEDGINLSDPFNRVNMARLCAAVVLSERGGGGVSGIAGSFYQMLTLLATRLVSFFVLGDSIFAIPCLLSAA